MNYVSNCIVCGKKLGGKQRRFCCVNCKNDYYLGYNSLKNRAATKKDYFLAKLGNKCARCGYSLSQNALSFYDHTGRSLHVDINVLANCSKKNIETKLAEAIILCRNCYEEIQAGEAISTNNDLNKTRETFSKQLFLSDLHRLTNTTDKIVLAISGGVDSVTMLDLMANNFPNDQLVVAHLNHGYREEALDDERLVRELAKYYGLEFYTKRVSPTSFGNLEENFRVLRREFLGEVANLVGAKQVALAHNKNDQAETVLMNLVRGSGPTGLGGMRQQEDMIIRPLLNLSREQIEDYATKKKLVWQDDKSNNDTRFARNYVRKEVLPLLARINPEYLENISRSSKIQQDLDSTLGQKSGLRSQLKAAGNSKNVNKQHYDLVEKQLHEGAGTKEVHLPGGIKAVSRYGKLEITPTISDNSVPKAIDNLKYGKYDFGSHTITVEPKNSKSSGKNQILIDEALLGWISVRAYEHGDKINKYGISGWKKLQDLYVDAKIDKEKRRISPIFVDNTTGEILWLPNLAIAKRLVPQKGNVRITVREEIRDEN